MASTGNALLSPHSVVNARPSFLRSLSSSSSIHTLSTKKDKPRLYLALYAKGGATPSSGYNANITCDSYHWTLIVGPKTASRSDSGICYQILHSSNDSAPAFYEETDLTHQSSSQSKTLLVRIALAKVVNEQKVQSLLRSLSYPTKKSSPPSKPNPFSASVHSSTDFDSTSTCLTWLRRAFRLLTSDPSKPLKSYIGPEDWNEVEECARNYVKKKRAQGRFAQDENNGDMYRTWSNDEIATWNFWERRETTQ